MWAGLARPQNIPHNFSSSRQINRLQISHGILYSDALEKRSQGSQNLRRPVRAAPSLPPPSAAFPFPPVEELDALRTCLCSQRSGLSLFALLFSFPLKFPFSLLLVIRIVRASWEHRDANPQIPTAISLSLLSLISFSRSIAGSSCHDGKKHPKFLAGAWPFNLGSNTLISSSTPFTCFSIFASANIVPATWHCRQKDQRVKAWWRGPGTPGDACLLQRCRRSLWSMSRGIDWRGLLRRSMRQCGNAEATSNFIPRAELRTSCKFSSSAVNLTNTPSVLLPRRAPWTHANIMSKLVAQSSPRRQNHANQSVPSAPARPSKAFELE